MALEAEVFDALEYLLNAVGDTKLEGEAATLLHALRDVQQLAYSETHPAKVSDVTGDPRQVQAAAQQAFDAAQAALTAANANVDPPTPASPADPSPTPVTPITPVEPPATPAADEPVAPSFSA